MTWFRSRLKLQHFVEEKQVGEHRAQMHRGVQVVHELRADGWLREHELNRRLRAPYVTFDDRDERVVGRRRPNAQPPDAERDGIAETGERGVAPAQEFADLAARRASFLIG